MADKTCPKIALPHNNAITSLCSSPSVTPAVAPLPSDKFVSSGNSLLLRFVSSYDAVPRSGFVADYAVI